MMYLVSYDLKGGDSADYSTLYAEFEKFDDCKRCLQSSWLVVTNKSASEVRDLLRAQMREHDLIVVVPYGENRSSWIPSDVVDWIHGYFGRDV